MAKKFNGYIQRQIDGKKETDQISKMEGAIYRLIKGQILEKITSYICLIWSQAGQIYCF